LNLDQDYSFYITALNPFEGEPSDIVTYRLAGRPDQVSSITDIPAVRTGQILGLKWPEPISNGGSPIIAYTLSLVTENMPDEIVYYGSKNQTILQNLIAGKQYAYHIKSTNLVGDSDWSAIYVFLMVDEPSEPLDLKIISFSDISIQL